MFVVTLILAFWFYANFKSTRNSVIALEINENKEIILDGNQTSFEEFSSVANSIVSKLKTQGISSDKIVIALRADRSLNVGVITDVQQELRNCDLNKIIYERK